MGSKYAVAATSDNSANTLSTPRAVLEVTVLDAVTKEVVPDALVDLSGAGIAGKGNTDAQGVVRFGDLLAGKYIVWAERDDYPSSSTEVEIPAVLWRHPVKATILLQPSVILEIVDDKGQPIPAGATTVVGRKVSLTVRSKPPGHALSDIEWTVPDERVKNYTQSTTQGKIFELGVADLKVSPIGFFWINGGAKEVRVVAKLKGHMREVKATFDVLAPTGVVLKSTTTTISIGPDPKTSEPSLRFGSGPHPGITFNFTATAPANGDGQIAAVQLTKVQLVGVFHDGFVETSRTTSGKFFLDDQVPYGDMKDAPVGVATTWTDKDSPSITLGPEMVHASFQDDFQIFFMYRPNGKDCIWVTLGRLDWHCKATARRQWPPGGKPTAWAIDPGADASTNPDGVASSELPLWSEYWPSGG